MVVLTKIPSDHPVYRRAAAREGQFWKGQPDDPTNPTSLPTPLLAYRAECETGIASSDRYSFIKSLGPFKHGLSIGCGSAVVERELLRRGIVDRFTFIDISEESLNSLKRSLPPRLRSRAEILCQDINFIDITGTYDFIFCANVLHHIVNLEHVLLQLNRALTPEGILYVDDFVGEDRFQFSDERIALINAAAHTAHAKTGVRIMPMERTSRKALINICPFEAVRASEIVPLLHQLFDGGVEREVVYGGVAMWMSVVVDMKDNPEKVVAASRIFVDFDRFAREHGVVLGLYLFGVYKKNTAPPRLRVKRWTKQEVRLYLPVSWFDEGLFLRAGDWLRRSMGDGPLYRGIRRSYLRLRG